MIKVGPARMQICDALYVPREDATIKGFWWKRAQFVPFRWRFSARMSLLSSTPRTDAITCAVFFGVRWRCTRVDFSNRVDHACIVVPTNTPAFDPDFFQNLSRHQRATVNYPSSCDVIVNYTLNKVSGLKVSRFIGVCQYVPFFKSVAS